MRGPLTWALARTDVRLGPIGQFAAAAGVVLTGTLIAVALYQLAEFTRLAIFFLASVVVCALLFGRRPAVFAAFLAFVAYNFSLVEPRFTFRLVGPDDVLTLGVFLVVALLVGGLAGRVRESERDSRLRADETAALLEASRAFGDATDDDAVARELDARLRAVAGDDPTARDAARHERLRALMIELASAARHRIQLVDARTELETEARAGRLRDAVLSSISHDLRTPLTTVLTSASSLQEYGDRFDLKTRGELAGVIVHEADRLNRYVERLLDLSRIEAGQVAPRLDVTSLTEVLDAALRRLPEGAEARVRTDDLDAAPPVLADARLLEQVVFNLLDNALLHGGPAALIDVRARTAPDGVRLIVQDDGPGVAPEDLEHLCDKFRRGRSPDAPGTGIGLAVVKGFVEAMGGALDLSSPPAGGLRVALTLRPAATA